MVPPLVLDVDGTLTRVGALRAPAPIDPVIFEPLREWDATIVLATGKAFPYPVALCHFIGIAPHAIAETGGVVCVGEHLEIVGDGAAARAVAQEMADRGQPPTPDPLNLINRWRETEVAFERDVPVVELQEVAALHGLHVVDTGFAYHVKDPSVSKGRALAIAADAMDWDLAEFVAIGDSVNDTSLFERVGRAIAVANADEQAQAAADRVTEAGFAEGTLEALADLAE